MIGPLVAVGQPIPGESFPLIRCSAARAMGIMSSEVQQHGHAVGGVVEGVHGVILPSRPYLSWA